MVVLSRVLLSRLPVPVALSRHVQSVLSSLSCHGALPWLSCSDGPLPRAVLSPLFYPGCSVPAALSQLSCPRCPVPAIFPPTLVSPLSCPCRHILAVLFFLFCQRLNYPGLSSPGRPGQLFCPDSSFSVLSWLSCHSFTVLVILSKQFCPSCHAQVTLSCTSVLSKLTCLDCQADLSRLTCTSCPAIVLHVLSWFSCHGCHATVLAALSSYGYPATVVQSLLFSLDVLAVLTQRPSPQLFCRRCPLFVSCYDCPLPAVLK
jgi:hypothetical protein